MLWWVETHVIGVVPYMFWWVETHVTGVVPYMFYWVVPRVMGGCTLSSAERYLVLWVAVPKLCGLVP